MLPHHTEQAGKATRSKQRLHADRGARNDQLAAAQLRDLSELPPGKIEMPYNFSTSKDDMPSTRKNEEELLSANEMNAQLSNGQYGIANIQIGEEKRVRGDGK